MHGVIPPLPQYAPMAWCLFKKKAQGQLYFHLTVNCIHERKGGLRPGNCLELQAKMTLYDKVKDFF
jgi:hypothetical protein